jgi:hypothetical protein
MPWREGPVSIFGGTEESTLEETLGVDRGPAGAESHTIKSDPSNLPLGSIALPA